MGAIILIYNIFSYDEALPYLCCACDRNDVLYDENLPNKCLDPNIMHYYRRQTLMVSTIINNIKCI